MLCKVPSGASHGCINIDYQDLPLWHDNLCAAHQWLIVHRHLSDCHYTGSLPKTVHKQGVKVSQGSMADNV